jgi:peptide/nickel transport system substrate-binding protein
MLSMMRSPLLAIATTALLAGCTSTDQKGASSEATGGTLIITPSNDAVDLFPPYVNETTGRLVQDQVFDRLAEINADLTTIGDKKFTPRLAQKWTWAPDSLSIAFSLDPRARWHDGKPVTANDVRYSLRAFIDPRAASPSAAVLSNLDSVSVKDSLTAVVWFKKRTPEQFYDVAYQLLIMPEHVYGGIPFEKLHTSELTRTLIGTGRFRFVKWQPGVRIELVADTANYRGRAKLDRVIIVPAIPTTAATQILAGQADFQDAFPTEQLPALEKSTVARPIDFPNFAYVFMAMNRFDPKATNSPHPIFGDLRVRRALSMGVNRQAMLENLFRKSGRLSHGPFTMTVTFADSALHPPPFDTTAAKAMLDSSGWHAGPNGMRAKNGRPLRFSISVPTSSAPRMRYAEMLQEQFRKLGVQVDLDVGNFATVNDRMHKHDFDAIMGAFSTDPSPSGAKQNWGTEGIGPTGQNFLRYTNRRVDALLDSSAASFDPARVKSYSSRAFQTIIDDAPAIFLYDMVVTHAINRRVNVAPFRTDEWWANLADWSIPADKRIGRDRIGLTPAKP